MSNVKPQRNPADAGRFAYEGLDRVIHEKARLGILTSLLSKPNGLLFNELKELCNLTDGNLSRHIQILQEAGLIEIWKGFRNRRPQTLCRITPAGKTRFRDYLNVLESVIANAIPEMQANDQTPPETLEGFSLA
jgi:DNA-binding MarR family transcriptional regulator